MTPFGAGCLRGGRASLRPDPFGDNDVCAPAAFALKMLRRLRNLDGEQADKRRADGAAGIKRFTNEERIARLHRRGIV